jgi:hypothetical protein
MMSPDATTRDSFYGLIQQVPVTEEDWTKRLHTLRTRRTDARFEPYWSAIDQMLTVDFRSYQRMAAALDDFAGLEDYDFEAVRRQRAYDLQHATDHLP